MPLRQRFEEELEAPLEGLRLDQRFAETGEGLAGGHGSAAVSPRKARKLVRSVIGKLVASAARPCRRWEHQHLEHAQGLEARAAARPPGRLHHAVHPLRLEQGPRAEFAHAQPRRLADRASEGLHELVEQTGVAQGEEPGQAPWCGDGAGNARLFAENHTKMTTASKYIC